MQLEEEDVNFIPQQQLEAPVIQQKQFINNVGNLIDQLNQQRLENADTGKYGIANKQLQNIKLVREHAQKTIKNSLLNKH